MLRSRNTQGESVMSRSINKIIKFHESRLIRYVVDLIPCSIRKNKETNKMVS
jgi:hypothetical protein